MKPSTLHPSAVVAQLLLLGARSRVPQPAQGPRTPKSTRPWRFPPPVANSGGNGGGPWLFQTVARGMRPQILGPTGDKSGKA